MKVIARIAVAIVVAVGLSHAPASAQVTARGISVDGIWARALPSMPGTADVYFQLVNLADETDRLLEASSDVADKAVVERFVFEGSRPVLKPAGALSIAPGSRVEFAPGQYQVTLKGLHKRLNVGDGILLSLRFERAGRVEVRAQVTNQLLGNRRR